MSKASCDIRNMTYETMRLVEEAIRVVTGLTKI